MDLGRMYSNSTNETNGNASADPLCQVAARALSTPGFSVLAIFIIAFGTIAVIFNILLFCAVWKVTLFHWNLRLLIGHLAFCSIVFSGGCAVKNGAFLSALLRQDPCCLVMDSVTCRLQDVARSWTNQALMYACASITVERLYCTVRYNKTYHGFPWLGILLTLLCYVAPIQNWIRSQVSSVARVAVCETLLSMTIDAAKINVSINVSFTIVSLILAGVLHYWNHSQLRSMLANRAITHTLAARFQLDQNIQLTQIIGPSSVLEFLTFLPNYVFLLLIMFGFELSYESKTVLIQVTYVWKICFCISYPLLAFWRNVHLRRGLIKATPEALRRILCKAPSDGTSRVNIIKITPTGARVQPHKTHFEILDKAWAKPVRRGNR